MYIYIDESGIHKNSGLSTVCILTVSSNLQELEALISETESVLELDTFHWASHGWHVKEKFLRRIFFSHLTKSLCLNLLIKKNPLNYYDFLAEALHRVLDTADIQLVTFDGQKTRSYERKLKNILRANSISTKCLVIKRDESSPLIRLADALAGLSRVHFENPEKREAENLFKFVTVRSGEVIVYWL